VFVLVCPKTHIDLVHASRSPTLGLADRRSGARTSRQTCGVP